MSGKVPSSESRTVLVVDDDPGIRETVVEVLGAEGYHVLSAGDGVEALAQLDALSGGCVLLLDLAMPRMDGLSVLNELSRRGHTDRTPVVVMSANAHPRELEFPQVVALLRKPFELDDLLRWVAVCSRQAVTSSD